MDQVILISFLLLFGVFSLLLKRNVVEYSLSWFVIFNALSLGSLFLSKQVENSLLEFLAMTLMVWVPVILFIYLLVIYKASRKSHFKDVGDEL